MKNLLPALMLSGLFLGTLDAKEPIARASTQKVQTYYQVPPEWVEHESTWLTWPAFEPIKGNSNIPQLTQMINIIQNQANLPEFVDLVVSNQAEENAAKTALSGIMGIDVNKIRFRRIPRTDFWTRDYSLFIKDSTPFSEKLAVVGFEFDAWGMGYKEAKPGNKTVSNYFNSVAKTDGNIDSKMANQALHIPFIETFITMEPGGLEFNYGQLIVSEAVIKQYERNNQQYTKAQIETELKRLFNLTDVYWLPKFDKNNNEILESDPAYNKSGGSGGLCDDDSAFYGPFANPQTLEFRQQYHPQYTSAEYDLAITSLATNGHTDEIVRWISDDTVLMATISDDEVAFVCGLDGRDPSTTNIYKTQKRLQKIKQKLESYGLTVITGLNIPGHGRVDFPVPNSKIYYLKPGDGTFDGLLGMYNTYPPEYAGTMVLDIYPHNVSVNLAARSYLNFVYTNEHILCPAFAPQDLNEDAYFIEKGGEEYTSTAKDEAVQLILTEIFNKTRSGYVAAIDHPRTVKVIDNVDAICISGGGLHCITQQMPAIN